jgi:hypothetical protein
VLGFFPNTHKDHHLRTLAALISGIVASGKTHLPAIAAKSQLGGKSQSRQKRYSRWLKNNQTSLQNCFFPFAQALLQSLGNGPLTLIMDGSEVGRGCLALMLAVVYQGRALPLVWTVVRGKKGHFPQAAHIQLVEQVKAILPQQADVVFLGDGEFDGVDLLSSVQTAGWKYACRTAKNILVCSSCCVPTPLGELAERSGLAPGKGITYCDMLFTAHEFGPVQVGAVWEPDHKEPIYLVTNLADLEEAHRWYKKRFRIETFFSDQKSRGFHIGHSHLSDPVRLMRLLIASCLAYYWIVCLGAEVLRQGWQQVVHRKDRCDLGLFRLGMEWLEHCLNQGTELPVSFANQW